MEQAPFPSWMGQHPRLNSPWSKEEDRVLVDAFNSGATLEFLTIKHGRNSGAIESRLNKLIETNFYWRDLRRVSSKQEAGEIYKELRVMKDQFIALEGRLNRLMTQ